MKELLKSEFLVNKYFLLTNLLLPIFLIPIVLIPSKIGLYTMFAFCILIISLSLVNSIIREKSRKNTDILYLSLPVYREHIMKSRYVTYSILPVLSSILLYLLIIFTRFEPLSYHRQVIGFDIIPISISITLIVLSFIIPLVIKSGKMIHVIGMFFYFLPYVGFRLIVRYNIDFRIDFPYGHKSLILLVIAIIIYLISMKISDSKFKKYTINTKFLYI